MKGMFFMSFIAIFFSTCAGCVLKEAVNSKEESLNRENQIELARCDKVWMKIMDEWRMNGGGLKSSVQETRTQIERDEKSRGCSR